MIVLIRFQSLKNPRNCAYNNYDGAGRMRGSLIKQEIIDLIRSKGGKRNKLKKAQKNRQRQNNNGGGCCIIS